MLDAVRTNVAALVATVAASVALVSVPVVMSAPRAHADNVTYLINVTINTDYTFAGPDGAIHYGMGICGKFSRGGTYAQVMGDIDRDFPVGDEHQAAYLIAQAIDQLCPALSGYVHDSAAHYPGPPPPLSV